MAPPARSSAPLILLLLAVFLAARCSAGDDYPAPMLDPRCQVMTEMCTVASCTELCIKIGLGKGPDGGFCTFRNMQFYCCCPIPADTPPSRL